jgi:hypothetical protein
MRRFAFSVLTLLLSTVVAHAGQKDFKITLASLKGQAYLDVYARVCDDKSWATIDAWAKKSHFAEQKLPQETAIFKNGAFEFEGSKDQFSYTKDGKLALKLGEKTYEGTACEVFAQAVTDASHEKVSLLDLFLPRAFAESPVFRTEDRTMLEKIGHVAARAGMGVVGGCVVGFEGVLLSGVGLVVPISPLGGCIAGAAIGGAGSAIVDAINIRDTAGKRLEREQNQRRLQSTLASLLTSGSPLVRTCSQNSIQVSNGDRIATFTTNPNKVEVRQLGKLLFQDTKIFGQLSSLKQHCNSPAQADAQTQALREDVARAQARLTTESRAKLNTVVDSGSAM